MKRIFSCFLDAYRRGRFATFVGRASREDFWYYHLGHMIINVFCTSLISLGMYYEWNDLANAALAVALDEPVLTAASLLSVVFACGVAAYAVFLIISIIPSLSLMVRRYHDVGVSGYVLGALLIAVPACLVFVGFRIWLLADDFYTAFPADPDTMLETGFMTEFAVIYFGQFLALLNFVILALPGKQVE